MKRKQGHSFSDFGKRLLIGTLSASMILSSVVWAGMNDVFDMKNVQIKAETAAYSQGDVNGDGKIDLEDARVTLTAALAITPVEGEAKTAADVDGNGSVNLDDALAILKKALGIEELPSLPPAESKKPTPAPPMTQNPSVTNMPKPTIMPPEAKESDVVEGMKLEVMPEDESDSDGRSTSVIENYQNHEGMYGFYANKDGSEQYGLEMINPFAGAMQLRESVASATSVEAVDGKENVWTLEGASIEARPPGSVFPPEIDNRVTSDVKLADEDNVPMELHTDVVYTVPEWKNGVTISFWAKLNQDANSDPLLVFNNDLYMLMIRANGSVRFVDSAEGKNQLNNGCNTMEPLGTKGEWNYYTVTIANDWVQVYINGQEQLFDVTNLSRKTIQSFNGGFLTRYNPLGTIMSEEEFASDPHLNYYYKKLDASATLDRPYAVWMYDERVTPARYHAHDNFSVIANSRFRGANGNGEFLMNYLTSVNSMMWLGGTKTGSDYSKYDFDGGAVIADATYYMQELTPEQIIANYTYRALPNKPEDVELPGEKVATPEPPKTPKPEPTVKPDEDEAVTGEAVTLRRRGLNPGATQDPNTGVYTFTARTPVEEGTNKYAGIRMNYPFNQSEDNDMSDTQETLQDALKGQTLFPFQDADGNYLAGDKAGTLKPGGGCDRDAVAVKYGNYYDVYYGNPLKYGNDPSIGTANEQLTSILTEDEVKAKLGDQVTAFHRPIWNNGLSFSFWAKPTVVDDSPLLTLVSNDMLFYVDVMGSVFYASRYSDPEDNTKGDWEANKALQKGGHPRNVFSTYGDASYVTANEWNYYTVTLANDWIQVYVNGKEMVYKQVNLNRGELKYFNRGYLSRYNTIGIWNTEQVAKYEASPENLTLEGTPRNYLSKIQRIKGGESRTEYIWDLTAGINSSDGYNSSADSASIRANNTYEDPIEGNATRKLLMELMTGQGMNNASVSMYLGGMYNILPADRKFVFSDLRVPASEVNNDNIHCEPISYEQDNVVDEAMASIYLDKPVTYVSKNTPGAYQLKDAQGAPMKEGNLVEGYLKFDENNGEIWVSEACNIVPSDAAEKYPLTKNKLLLTETSSSRAKIFSSDHTISEGTQITDVRSYRLELNAKQVKKNYEKALETAPAN